MRRTPTSAPLRRPLPRGSSQEPPSWHRGYGEMPAAALERNASASETCSGTSARRTAAAAARACPRASSVPPQRARPAPSSKLPGARPRWLRHDAPLCAAFAGRDVSTSNSRRKPAAATAAGPACGAGSDELDQHRQRQQRQRGAAAARQPPQAAR